MKRTNQKKEQKLRKISDELVQEVVSMGESNVLLGASSGSGSGSGSGGGGEVIPSKPIIVTEAEDIPCGNYLLHATYYLVCEATATEQSDETEVEITYARLLVTYSGKENTVGDTTYSTYSTKSESCDGRIDRFSCEFGIQIAEVGYVSPDQDGKSTLYAGVTATAMVSYDSSTKEFEASLSHKYSIDIR